VGRRGLVAGGIGHWWIGVQNGGVDPSPLSARKCQCCSGFFLPARTNRATQRFCSLAACRQASKARSNRQWRSKNPGYDSGPEQVARVQRWRAQNPGYGHRNRRQKTPWPLQDFVPTQTPDPEPLTKDVPQAPRDFVPGTKPAATSCNGVPAQIGPALQDFVHTQDPLVVGLIATILGDALQESFGSLTRHLVEQGRRVLAAQLGAACGP
jgi:hypothetical protein